MTLLGSYVDGFHNCDNSIPKRQVIQTPYHVDVNVSSPKLGMSKPVGTGDRIEQNPISYTIGNNVSEVILGRGGYSKVYRAVDLKSGQVVALKKARVPLKVKRPGLQHESRVLQMLQGHPAIPQLLGYGQLEHFEFMSMEVLGPSLRAKAIGKSLTVISVVRIVVQVLSALKHVHKHGLFHRDIKPENLLCSNRDPSRIMLIDFGMAKCMSSGPPRTYNPTKEKKYIVGTPNWASLHSHHGIDLGPGDDLESLAYISLFLLRGNLPWRANLPAESVLRCQARIQRSKAAFSGTKLAMHFPADFAYLLDYSRGLDYHQKPDYGSLEHRFSRLAEDLGGYNNDDPLDWTPVVPPVETKSLVLDQNNWDLEDDDADYNPVKRNDISESPENSYYASDIDCWDDIHTSRNASLTLPTDFEELADSQIPAIIKMNNLHPVKGSLSYGIRVSDPVLGRGGYSYVFKAEDLNSGQIVALKKSRVSLNVKRPFLRHESRVLKLLQGHPSIPTLYGYGHLEHFEYMSMEVLGPSVGDKVTEALTVLSVVRIVEQILYALKHIHKYGIIHRDIKPENLLCSNYDPSRIMLIDFGIARCTGSGPPRTYDVVKEKKHIVGTVHWASLNSHRGIDLAPGDDVESLAYTALFLLRGNIPWRGGHATESILRSQARIHKAKAAVSGVQLAMHFPSEFAYLLDYSRGLEYNQIPDYDNLEDRFARLAEALGGYDKNDPLDWTSVPPVLETTAELEFLDEDGADYSENDGKDYYSKLGECSYVGVDIDCWENLRFGLRHASLTLPTQLEEFTDNCVPSIIKVQYLAAPCDRSLFISSADSGCLDDGFCIS